MKKSKKIICTLLSFLLVIPFTTLGIHSVNTGELPLSAKSAVLIDASNGNILYSKNSSEKMEMASTTKIMTAIVAAENSDLKKTVKIAPEAVGVEGSSIYLREGEQFTVEELLYALLLQSANDAATAIAYAVAGGVEQFADMMNTKAQDLGLESTHFTNPHGLSDEDHYTTAYELALVAMCALENETVREIVSTYKKSLPIDSDSTPRVLVNHNKMLKLYNGAIGVKTGFTKRAGRCLVSAAERDGLTLIAVTLNAPDDWRDHTQLLDFGFDTYESLLVAEPGEFSYALPVTGGKEDFVTLTNTDELRLTVPKDRGDITFRVETIHRFEFAPTHRGTEGGIVFCEYGEVAFDSSPLIYAENVDATNDEIPFWDRIFKK